MPPRRNKEEFQKLTEFEWRRIFLWSNRSPCAAEHFHSDASFERRAPNNSKNWQWTTEGAVSRRYADESYLPECVIERHSGLTPGVMFWGAISYHGRSNLLRIEGIPGANFQQDNARPHVSKTVRDFCSAQHMQPDMLPIEHMWDMVGRRLARYLRPAVPKDELLLRIQTIRNSLSQADIQNLFDSMPRRIEALIAARGGYTKY
ncbi:transposable element Tc1 transposase [Trichonephila clavipes]|nr:transposable element Tc1 transposase [Trichonephila clavipes]